jgi:probable HAF family extracellular repeat protein
MAGFAQRRRECPLVLERLEDRCLLSYSITDLGTLGGATSTGSGINDLGQACGVSGGNGFNFHAFLWEDGAMLDLGTLGGSVSYGYGLNDVGQVVGSARISSEDTDHAFLWENGAMMDLGTLGGILSGALHINNAGQAVGGSWVASYRAHATLWDHGVITDLGTFGGTNSVASGINDSVQIVGQSDLPGGGGAHAFLWQDGQMTDLGGLGSGDSAAVAVNDAGQIVGWSGLPSGQGFHATLWQDGVATDLGAISGFQFSQARSINEAGQVVGDCQYSDTLLLHHAFLYADGVMSDLNDLLPANSGWELLFAQSINNSGEIVGTGTNPEGKARAYLLTPDDSTIPRADLHLSSLATQRLAVSFPPSPLVMESIPSETTLSAPIQRVAVAMGEAILVKADQGEAALPVFLARTSSEAAELEVELCQPSDQMPDLLR